MLHQNSKDSYQEHVETGRRDTWRKRVYDFIEECEEGATDREVMEGLNTMEVNNIRPEITRMKQDGLIVELGKTRCKVTKKAVRVVMASGMAYFDKQSLKKVKC